MKSLQELALFYAKRNSIHLVGEQFSIQDEGILRTLYNSNLAYGLSVRQAICHAVVEFWS